MLAFLLPVLHQVFNKIWHGKRLFLGGWKFNTNIKYYIHKDKRDGDISSTKLHTFGEVFFNPLQGMKKLNWIPLEKFFWIRMFPIKLFIAWTCCSDKVNWPINYKFTSLGFLNSYDFSYFVYIFSFYIMTFKYFFWRV